MSECKIYLDSSDQSGFYGVNHRNIDVIKKYFPKLKIVIRGNEIKAEGEPDEIQEFKRFLERTLKYLREYNSLSKKDLEMLFLQNSPISDSKPSVLIYGNSGRPVKAKNKNQRKMAEDFYKKDLIFAVGPAGTGKTYMAISLAVKALKEKQVRRIVLSRPAVEAGERLGFLPGDLKMKLDPYLQALYDALYDLIPGRKLNDYMEQGVVQIAPLAYMRGRTLSGSVVILDEAQNTTFSQLKMFLTRMGEGSKFIVTGDMTQIDLPDKRDSGLVKASNLLADIDDISFIRFGAKDIIRHPLVGKIVDAFEKSK